MNHDYFTRPVRSDRTHHTYGHTSLTPTRDPHPTVLLWIFPVAAITAIVGMVLS